MSDVKVTREHRKAACQALGISDELFARKWAAGDDDTNWTDDMRDVARELAQAEHRVRAVVIADLKALAEQADIVDQGSSVLYVRVDSIESLIIELEAQQS